MISSRFYSTSFSEKILCCFFFLLFQNHGNAQEHQLNETDTSLNYKEKFYRNNELNLHGYNVYIVDTLNYYSTDSALYYDFHDYPANEDMDSTKMFPVKHGTYKIEMNDRKNGGYYLAEYAGGVLVGKRYNFRRDGTLQSTFLRFPKIKDSVFQGSQIIYYDKKGIISEIEYLRFNEDVDSNFFFYVLFYNKTGALTTYSYYNDKIGINYSREYNKNAELIYDCKRTPEEWYIKEWSHNRKRLKVSIRDGSGRTISIYKNEKLVREKQLE